MLSPASFFSLFFFFWKRFFRPLRAAGETGDAGERIVELVRTQEDARPLSLSPFPPPPPPPPLQHLWSGRRDQEKTNHLAAVEYVDSPLFFFFFFLPSPFFISSSGSIGANNERPATRVCIRRVSGFLVLHFSFLRTPFFCWLPKVPAYKGELGFCDIAKGGTFSLFSPLSFFSPVFVTAASHLEKAVFERGRTWGSSLPPLFFFFTTSFSAPAGSSREPDDRSRDDDFFPPFPPPSDFACRQA